MIKVSIYSGETLTNQGEFDTQETAEAWVSYHNFSDPVYEDTTEKELQDKINQEAEKFLLESDWKVMRHRDQQDMGLATSLTGEEFQQLLQERQMAREAIIRN